ncbi:F1F0 ATPase subunit 2 [Marinobacterium halophilum]|uniref:F1F0 ATPase subunit 2 n=1 Tax=Marinobacterium halophilum TaxID=267374 RepID=A0A2P8F3F0_9GAMM|nr:ATP synthase subunit I [Marinobacterium halophilum]PSL16241.1 F1F0 ATPase subunit 2 [Marinobacterium halophilum]
MSETLIWGVCATAGLGLGMLFFGGLWWTVRHGITSPRPALLFITSLLLRMSITLAGFYWVADGQWQRMLACLLGFVIARLILMRVLGPSLRHVLPLQENGHAP